MLVYRIQKPDGKGPYASFSERLWTTRTHSAPEHPSPDREGLNIQHGEICGFESIDKLRSWFNDKELNALHSLEYVVAVFKVSPNSCKVGNKQVVFKRNRLVKAIDIKDMLKGFLYE